MSEKLAENRMTDTEHELVHRGIISALAVDFADLYGYNFVKDEIHAYRVSGNAIGVAEKLPMGYEQALRSYIQHNVYSDDQQMLFSMSTKDYVVEMLRQKESYIVHYRVKRDRELHYYYMKAARVGAADSFESYVLAFANEDEEIFRKMAREMAVPGNITAKRQILLIGDTDSQNESLISLLTSEYQMITAANGKDAMDILLENYRTISVILLDLQILANDNYDFLYNIRNDILLSNIPVIVLAEPDQEEQCMSLDAADYLLKPYRASVVLRRIKSTIRLRESYAVLTAIEFDELTGLYTREAFIQHAESMLKREPEAVFDMFIAEIEDFSLLNERYGRGAVDDLMCYITRKIVAFDAQNAIYGRYAANQIVSIRKRDIVYSEEEFLHRVKELAEKSPIQYSTVRFSLYENVEHALSISVTCDRILRTLDSIRHQYNQLYTKYDHRIQQQIEAEQLIEDYMVEGLREKQFLIYYQPKHDVKTGSLCGAEALIRWKHPVYGFLSPTVFIPQFEKNGFITKIDTYVWTKVCQDLKEWKEKGLSIVPVSVNASRRDFFAISDLSTIGAAVAHYEIDKEYLHIEVTESFYANKEDRLIDRIWEIKKQGFSIEMDDFGSGYSSLSMIKKIPMDIIKLDVGFIRNLEEQKEIIRIIIEMAHALGKKVTAEGVESAEQLKLLRDFGCDSIQGYYYSKPLTKDGFENYMKKQKWLIP